MHREIWLVLLGAATAFGCADTRPPDYTKNDTKQDDLAVVIDAWPELPEAVRAGIVAMVAAFDSKGGDGGCIASVTHSASV